MPMQIFVDYGRQRIQLTNLSLQNHAPDMWLCSYGGCPIIWASQLQSEIALSTTEAEYLALSTALRNTIPLMRLLNELKDKITTTGYDTYSLLQGI
jgi:hypothetical protein